MEWRQVGVLYMYILSFTYTVYKILYTINKGQYTKAEEKLITSSSLVYKRYITALNVASILLANGK